MACYRVNFTLLYVIETTIETKNLWPQRHTPVTRQVFGEIFGGISLWCLSECTHVSVTRHIATIIKAVDFPVNFIPSYNRPFFFVLRFLSCLQVELTQTSMRWFHMHMLVEYSVLIEKLYPPKVCLSTLNLSRNVGTGNLRHPHFQHSISSNLPLPFCHV